MRVRRLKSHPLLVGMACLMTCGCGGSSPSSTAPSPSPAPAPVTRTLSGTVTDAATDQPITGAAVSINDGPNAGRATASNASGAYSLSGLNQGGFTARAFALCYVVLEQGVTLAQDTQVNFVLQPLPTPPSAAFSQIDLREGTGVTATQGRTLRVSYVLWLYDPTRTDSKGSQVDNSSSFSFQLGVGQVIQGWDRGVMGMRVGGQRRLIVPPDLAYGCQVLPGLPVKSTLVFDITLLAVN